VAVTKDMLSDFHAGNPIQVRCCRVAEKACVKGFSNPCLIGGFTEDVLQGALGDAFTAP